MEGVARAADTTDLTTEWGGEGRGGAGSQRGAGETGPPWHFTLEIDMDMDKDIHGYPRISI